MRYRLLAPDETELDAADARAEVRDGTLTITPALGQPLRIQPADIGEVRDAGPGALDVVLTDGTAVHLRQLGRMHGQLLADLLDARGQDQSRQLLLVGVGRAESFPATVDGVPAQLRLYDDALVALPRVGEPEQLLFTFVADVVTDDGGYRIEVRTRDGRVLAVGGLGRRTGEFVDQLRDRVTAARNRIGYLVDALLPGLPARAARGVAAALADGVAAPQDELDGAEPGVFAALVRACTLPQRLPPVLALADLGELSFGLHQRTTVERPAAWAGGAPPAVTVAAGDHGGIPAASGGLAAVVQAGMVERLGATGGGPAGDHGPDIADLVAYRLLAGPGTIGPGTIGPWLDRPLGHEHREVPRAVPRTGWSMPAWTQLSALRVDGQAPTVLAFLLCRTPGGEVVYEVLNETDHATYVFDRGPGQPAVNRALAMIGFRVRAIIDDGGPASRYRRAVQRLPHLRALRESYRGRVEHTEGWSAGLGSLLATGRPPAT